MDVSRLTLNKRDAWYVANMYPFNLLETVGIAYLSRTSWGRAVLKECAKYSMRMFASTISHTSKFAWSLTRQAGIGIWSMTPKTPLKYVWFPVVWSVAYVAYVSTKQVDSDPIPPTPEPFYGHSGGVDPHFRVV